MKRMILLGLLVLLMGCNVSQPTNKVMQEESQKAQKVAVVQEVEKQTPPALVTSPVPAQKQQESINVTVVSPSQEQVPAKVTVVSQSQEQESTKVMVLSPSQEQEPTKVTVISQPQEQEFPKVTVVSPPPLTQLPVEMEEEIEVEEEIEAEIKEVEEVAKEPALALESKIGSMLMIGFMGTEVTPQSQICQDIRNYHLGGVILFDVNPLDKRLPKNFKTKAQVKALTEQLQACSEDHKLLIAVDQEGGRVQRLKEKYGFNGHFKKAKEISTLSDQAVLTHYEKMGAELASVGINYNLAPDVDLALNPKNRVIYKLGRSFGRDPQQVAHYATLFIDAMHQHGVLTAVKHFPGHGSSLGDTHKGFVDVTTLWQPKELDPYRILSQAGVLDTVMVAHVFNKKIDAQYPATLSKKTIKGLLRQEIGFDGVVITDDLQMGAIAHKYGLEKTLALAIGAGNDILLFGNQLSVSNMVTAERLVNTIKSMIGEEIDLDDIEASYRRISHLKASMGSF